MKLMHGDTDAVLEMVQGLADGVLSPSTDRVRGG
jgi:hypothetical protein